MFLNLLFGLSEVLYGIFALSFLANRPLCAANRERKVLQKHLSYKLDLKTYSNKAMQLITEHLSLL